MRTLRLAASAVLACERTPDFAAGDARLLQLLAAFTWCTEQQLLALTPWLAVE